MLLFCLFVCYFAHFRETGQNNGPVFTHVSASRFDVPSVRALLPPERMSTLTKPQTHRSLLIQTATSHSHSAKLQRKAETIAALLAAEGVEVSSPNLLGVTPLLLACRARNVQLMRQLILLGADVNGGAARDDGGTIISAVKFI